MAAAGIKGSRLRHRTGLIRDTPDRRDFIRRYGDDEIPSTEEHPVVDLRGDIVQVFNQDLLDCCVASVLCSAYELLVQKQAHELNHIHYDFKASRLFVYYNARGLNSTIDEDSGASMRQALMAIHHYGVCHEALWPFKISEYRELPRPACYTDAEGNKLTKYESLAQDRHQLRACLKEGFPFAFGFEVYNSLETEITENGKMPLPSDEEIQGGASELHSVLCVGYDDNIECFTVLNSWGKSFGDGGYFYMPYKYILDPERSFDFWKLSEVTERGLNSTEKK